MDDNGIFEVAQLHVDPDRLDEFTTAATAALDIVRAAPGCRGIRLLHCVEDASKPIFIVNWDRLDDHAAFRRSDAFAAYRAAISPFFTAAPTPMHYADPTEAQLH